MTYKLYLQSKKECRRRNQTLFYLKVEQLLSATLIRGRIKN